MVDMQGMRPALAEVQMEAGNQSLWNKLNQMWDKNIASGANLSTQDLKEFWQSARSTLKAMQTERRGKAAQLKAIADGYHVSPEKLATIVHPKYVDYGLTGDLEGMPETLPAKPGHGAPKPTPKDNPKPSSADDLWDEVSK
jgi:hypothetical protein